MSSVGNRFLSRTMKVCLLFFLFGVLAFSGVRVQQYRFDLPPSYQQADVLAISPEILQIAAGDFRALLADYYLLKISYFVGGVYHATHKDWQAVSLLLQQVMALDPCFFTPLYYTQGLLSWRDGMIDDVILIMEQGQKDRHWDWEIPFYLATDYLFGVNDREKAQQAFYTSAQRPGAPGFIASLSYRLSDRKKRTSIALQLLHHSYEQSEDPEIKEAILRRINAYEGVLEIERALAIFKAKQGRKARDLAELVSSGIIPRLPLNPYAEKYYYDPETEEVNFKTGGGL